MILEARDVACIRGGRLVFEGVSFRLAPGEAMALTGPNGSGKSSLLRILAGLLPPARGQVAIAAGQASEGESGHVHYLGHLDALKPALTLGETLRFWAALCGAGASSDQIIGAARAVGLQHAIDLPSGILSAGQRRRAGLARLLLAPRPLWLLDEPAAALDAQGEGLVGTLMDQHLAGGGSIVAATHGPLPVRAGAMLRFGAAG